MLLVFKGLLDYGQREYEREAGSFATAINSESVRFQRASAVPSRVPATVLWSGRNIARPEIEKHRPDSSGDNGGG